MANNDLPKKEVEKSLQFNKGVIEEIYRDFFKKLIEFKKRMKVIKEK